MQVGYKDPKDDLHSYWGEKKITNGRNWVYAACLPMINPQITHLSPVDLLLLSAQPVPPPPLADVPIFTLILGYNKSTNG